METSKEILKIQVKMQSFFSKVDALVEALDDHQKSAYREALRRKRDEYVKRNEETFDEELLKLVDQLFQ